MLYPPSDFSFRLKFGAFFITRSTFMSYETISAKDAKLLMDANPDCIIVDVRRPDEFSLGHIPGAINVPLTDIQQKQLPSLMDDKNSVYLIYCRSGVRSVTAAKLLEQTGYTRLINFGGILDWPYEIEY